MTGRRLVGTFVLLSAFSFATATAAEDRPSISVNGLGKINAVPDIAEISVGVVTQASGASAALAANTESMTKLMTLLKERGVASKDVETTNISINPMYSQEVARPQGEEFIPRIIGYRVNNNVRVTVRRIASLGKLLDDVVQAGANEMYGIAFRVDASERLLDEARRRAMADAKRKAELLAGEAGVVLGKPIRISESSASVPSPQPMFMGGMAGGGMMARMAAPAPVSAGEQELSVSVQVLYGIDQPK